jgi:hypothetical protein
MVGNIQLLRAAPELVLPWRNPIWARFMSHKVLRLASPVLFIALLLASALLPAPQYRLFLGLQLGAYGLGFLGLVAPIPALAVPAAFVMMQGAVLSAFRHWGADSHRVWTNGSVGAETPDGAGGVGAVPERAGAARERG